MTLSCGALKSTTCKPMQQRPHDHRHFAALSASIKVQLVDYKGEDVRRARRNPLCSLLEEWDLRNLRIMIVFNIE